jgi:hypothetical protein
VVRKADREGGGERGEGEGGGREWIDSEGGGEEIDVDGERERQEDRSCKSPKRTKGDKKIKSGREASGRTGGYCLLARVEMDEAEHFSTVVHLRAHLLEFAAQDHVAVELFGCFGTDHILLGGRGRLGRAGNSLDGNRHPARGIRTADGGPQGSRTHRPRFAG